MLKLKKQRRDAFGSPHTKVNKMNRTLTYPVGMVQGTFCQNQSSAPKELANLLCLCNCYVAFGYSYIQQASEWSSNTINDILLQANNLMQASRDASRTHQLTAKSILQTFNIQTHLVEVHTSEPEVIGSLAAVSTATASTVHNGLRVFFRRKRRTCLFQCQTIYLLIWKEDGIFYVFDSHGRTDQCEPDRNDGCASLVCLASLANVTYLIEHLSELVTNECYMLTELKVKKLQNRGTIETAAQPPHTTFTVLNEHSAVVHGTLTAHDCCFTSTRNLQALTSCCIAFVYNLIHPPNSWTSLVVDKVLLLGNQLYKECTSFVVPEEFSIADLPPHINIGPHSASVQVAPNQNRGRLYHNLDVDPKRSELMREMRSVLMRHDCALLQVDTLVYCVWKRDGMFYMFDTYTRRRAVRPGQGDASDGDAACLQMHSTLDSLCAVLLGVLMKVAEKETFHLHGLAAGIVETTANWNGMTSISERGALNESVDELFVPKLKCRTLVSARRKAINEICNLDSPTVSATQFIQSWQTVKDELAQNESGEEDSDATVVDDDDDDDDVDRPDPPNNSLGLTNDDYTRLTALGLTDEDIYGFLNLSLSSSEIAEWCAVQCTPQLVERLQAINIASDEFKKLKKQKLTIEEMEQMKEFDLPVAEYLKLKHKGLTLEEIRAAVHGKANMKEYKTLGLNAHEIGELQSMNVSASDFALYQNMGLTFDDIMLARKLGISPETFSDMRSKNMTNVDIIKALDLQLSAEEYMAMKELEMNPNDISKCQRAGISPEDYMHLKKMNLVSEENLQRFRASGMTPEQYKKQSKLGEANIEDGRQTNKSNAADKLSKIANDQKSAKDTQEKNSKSTIPEEKASRKDLVTGTDTKDGKSKLPEATSSRKDIAKTASEMQKESSGAKATSSKTGKPKEEDTANSAKKQSAGVKETWSNVSKANENVHQEKQVNATISKAGKPAITESEHINSDMQLSNGSTETDNSEVTSAGVASGRSVSKTTSLQSVSEVGEASGSSKVYSTSATELSDHRATNNLQDPEIEPEPVSSRVKLDNRKPNDQPAVDTVKHNLGVVKSATGKVSSLLKLLGNAFKMVDRVLIMNNFGGADCVAFRSVAEPPVYYLLEGCACNKELIRRVIVPNVGHLLRQFKTLDDLVARVVKMSPGPPDAEEELDTRLVAVVDELSKLLDDLCVLKGNK